MKNSTSGINLLRSLANEGLRIFTTNDARKAAVQLGMNPAYVAEALYHLLKGGWVFRLKKGVYAFSSESGFGLFPHEFAIAMALVSPCAISHWTAMHYHHLTQQIPHRVFAIIPTGTSVPRFIEEPYCFVRVKKEHFFGYETVWIENSQVQITDLERTLLDGISRPEFCGGSQEVLHAFKMGLDRIKIDKIITYALKLDTAVIKRLGYILEKLGVPEKKLLPLLEIPVKSYRKFDPKGPLEGKYNLKWKIQENF